MVFLFPLDPTQKYNVVAAYNNVIEDDNATVPTSNCSSSTARRPENICPASPHPSLAATARQLFGSPSQQYLNAIAIKMNQAIADTGATSIFIMEPPPINNLRPLLQPLNKTCRTVARYSRHTCATSQYRVSPQS